VIPVFVTDTNLGCDFMKLVLCATVYWQLHVIVHTDSCKI